MGPGPRFLMAFGFVDLWKAIEALDNEVDDAVQSAMLLDTSRLIGRGTTWFLRSRVDMLKILPIEWLL